MLADVRPLRRGGQRLGREQLGALTPQRGELQVFKRLDSWRGVWVPVAALVKDDGSSYVLPPLDQVRIARWQGPDLVLVGLEEPDRHDGATRVLQSWWVRLVTPAARRQSTPAPPGG